MARPKKDKEEVAPQGGSLAGRLASAFKDHVVLGSEPLDSDIRDYVSTQCAMLDYTIGRPGIPLGRLTTIFGREGSSKSRLVYHILAEVQRRGGLAVLVDTEKRFSKDVAAALGLNLAELLVIIDLSIESVFERIEKLIIGARKEDSDVPVVVAIDSLSSLAAEAVLGFEEDKRSSQPALVAKYLSQNFPRIIPLLARTSVALMIVNQTRSHFDMSSPLGRGRSDGRRKVMGENTAMLAENELVFYSSLMLHVASIGTIKNDDNLPVGITSRATIRKVSISPKEGHQCTFDTDFLDGVDRVGSKLDLLVKLGHVKESGGWYKLEGQEKGFRRGDFAAVLESNPELDEIIHQAPEAWTRGGK